MNNHSSEIRIGAYVLLLSAWLALFSAGCGHKPQDSEPTRLTIAFQEWVGYGLFYLAQEKGFFSEEDLELVFVDEQLDSARRDAFKLDMLDCEAGTLDLLVSKAAQDTPIVMVMAIDHSFGADGIVASENIKTLEDLINKKVALARDDIGEMFISYLFQQNGLSLTNVIIVPTRPEKAAQSFLDGEADACVTWEPHLSRALNKPGAHLLTSSREHPDIIIDTLNVRRDLLERNPALVKKLMRGWFKALRFFKKQPNEASETIAPHYKITAAEYRKQVEGLKWIDYQTQKTPGKHKEWIGVFDAILEIKAANGRISNKPDAPKFLNHALLENLYE